jgi:hypothetical protein
MTLVHICPPQRRCCSSYQIPPNLVVKYQVIDIVEAISSLMWRTNIIQTPCRNRKWRCGPLSPSETHRSTTKSGGMWPVKLMLGWEFKAQSAATAVGTFTQVLFWRRFPGPLRAEPRFEGNFVLPCGKTLPCLSPN